MPKRRRKSIKLLRTRKGVRGQTWFLIGTYDDRTEANNQAADMKEEGFLTSVRKTKDGDAWSVWVHTKGSQTRKQTAILEGRIRTTGTIFQPKISKSK
ncbi:hypothetical protein LCGC14_0429380 [marine sediment metagenome]|uniref:SPOR domain-containing protein n=1 Tax=marine sediment metagenome TaxID=412755 RepID=A0A0F9VXS1_9ZZZZ